jgi:hypothetical protein
MAKGNGKIVKNDDYLFAAAGDLRAINILEHVFNPPDALGYSGKDLDTFITADFIPALRRCFEEQGYADGPTTKSDSDSKESASQGSTVLVVVNGSVYEIDEDYSWVKDVSGLYAMGTGGDYAIGALYALIDPKKKLTPDAAKEMAKEALNIGIKLDSSSGGALTILLQETE